MPIPIDAPPKHRLHRRLSEDIGIRKPTKTRRVDERIAASVLLIAKVCVSLEALTLHIIAIGGVGKIPLDSHRTRRALAKLVPSLERYRSSLQPQQNLLKELCELIAPLRRWEMGRSGGWPLRWDFLTVRLAQLEFIRVVTDKSSKGDYQTRNDVVCVQVAMLRLE